LSNILDYRLDVLATSPVEIDQIADRLNRTSLELADWIAHADGTPVSEVVERLKQLLDFKAVQNLEYVAADFNKAPKVRPLVEEPP